MLDASNKLSWVEGRGLVAEICAWRCPKSTFVSITRCIWTTTLSKCRVILKSMCTNVALCETHRISYHEWKEVNWSLRFVRRSETKELVFSVYLTMYQKIFVKNTLTTWKTLIFEGFRIKSLQPWSVAESTIVSRMQHSKSCLGIWVSQYISQYIKSYSSKTPWKREKT